MTPSEYTMKEVEGKTGLSKSTIVRWEEAGVFPKPKRRARNKARIFTDEHVQKILDHKNAVEEPPEKPAKAKAGRKR